MVFLGLVLPIFGIIFGVVAFAKQDIEHTEVGLKGHFIFKDLSILGILLFVHLGFEPFVSQVYEGIGLVLVSLCVVYLGVYFEEFE